MSSAPVPDPEVAGLIEAANSLQAGYPDPDSAWRDSSFAWIKARPSRQVGVIGERLVAAWLESKGLTVERSPDAECDRVIQGKRVEVQFSTLCKSGVYRFQQIREQNYNLVICLGLSPFDAHCWVIPKAQVLEQ